MKETRVLTDNEQGSIYIYIYIYIYICVFFRERFLRERDQESPGEMSRGAVFSGARERGMCVGERDFGEKETRIRAE